MNNLASLTLNNVAAIIILGTFILYNLLALPKLIRELLFYSKHGWNFRVESPQKIPLQEGFRQKFSFMPIGIIKIRVFATQVVIALGPIAWLLYPIFRQQLAHVF